MKYNKTKLSSLNRAYSTSCLLFDDKQFVVYASEANVGEPGEAYAFPLDDLSKKEVIWNNAGGCMTMIQHPYKKNAFVAIQEFYLKQHPSKAKIVEVERKNADEWEVKDLIHLPFVHRFGFIRDEEKTYIVCCTIAQDKLTKDDWSKPGEVWAGEFPKDGAEIELEKVYSGYFHNHGFYQAKENGKDVIYFSSDEGVHRLSYDNGFELKDVLEGAIGEIALKDIDNDGKDELITIEPFHGNAIKLYHLDEKNSYKEVWQYDREIDFAHALTGDVLCGVNCFVCGIRRKDAECVVVYCEDGTIKYDIVDVNGGPANLCVIHDNGKDYISCSNHTAGECAIYEVNK